MYKTISVELTKDRFGKKKGDTMELDIDIYNNRVKQLGVTKELKKEVIKEEIVVKPKKKTKEIKKTKNKAILNEDRENITK